MRGGEVVGSIPQGLPQISAPSLEMDKLGALFSAALVIALVGFMEAISIAKAVAGQLKRVGVDVQIESLEFQTFSKQLADGLVSAWIAPWTGYKDPDHLRFVFHSKQVPPFGGNRGFYASAKVDDLLEKGKNELDMGKRVPFYKEAQRLLSDDMPYVYLWYKLSHVVTAKGVEGFKPYADGRYVSLTEVTKK
jgi:peptide/nickel transport system substrate-binding protein